MARGFIWAMYIDDEGGVWVLRVDRDYAADPDRGWATEGLAGLPPLPHFWRARRVLGIDSNGATQTAIVATTIAPLWTGTVSTFTFETTSLGLDTATVVNKMSERRRGPV
jgi:hypothetical protein